MNKHYTSAIDEEADQIAQAVFGDAPLESIAPYFESREALLRFYAGELIRHHAAKEANCEFCKRTKIKSAGFWRLNWHAKTSANKEALGSIFKVGGPAIVVLGLAGALGDHISPHLFHRDALMGRLRKDWRLYTAVEVSTHHPICPSCWRKQRKRNTLSIIVFRTFLVTLIINFVLALLAILGALVVLDPRYPVNLEEVLVFAAIGAFLTACGIGQWFAMKHFALTILVPASHRKIAKAPFRIVDSKLLPIRFFETDEDSI